MFDYHVTLKYSSFTATIIKSRVDVLGFTLSQLHLMKGSTAGGIYIDYLELGCCLYWLASLG